MVFKNFYWRVFVRVTLLTAILFLLSYCVVADMWLRATYLFVFAIIAVGEMIYFLTKFTNNIKTFLIGLQQQDFSLHFEEREDAFKGMYQELNKVITSFKKIGGEREIQYRFLEMLVEHIRVGIISFDEHRQVYLANNAFRELVGKKSFQKFMLDDLPPALVQTFLSISAGETRSVELTSDARKTVLAVYASSFRMPTASYKLLSVQDITHELNTKELESWSKLMRVLTHEIMNSISPIVSLSDTLYTMVQNARGSAQDTHATEAVKSGLDAIRIRSKGLLQFTESYRKLSRIPAPVFAKVEVRKFITQVTELISEEMRNSHIELSTDVEEGTADFDKTLIEHVLLNLIKNAIEALHGREDRRIEIRGAFVGQRLELQVSDNGAGILPEEQEQIFIPFFTTKKNGTGIGLAIARQIMQLHSGEISFKSVPNQRTTFTLIF